MKTTRILAVVLALITVATLTLAFNTSAEDYKVVLDGKTDVLDGLEGLYTNPNENSTTSLLTDGVYAADVGSKVYFNVKWNGSESKAREAEANGGSVELALKGGTTAKYLYTLEYFDVNADITGFTLYFNSEKLYTGAFAFPNRWVDSGFDILVSKDGGTTYEKVYSSIKLEINEDGSVKVAPGFPVESGGSLNSFWVNDEVTGDAKYGYSTIEATFAEEIKGVTNVVYACSAARRSGDDSFTKSSAFQYAVRMTEFDVYGTKKAVDSSATTEAATTAAPVTTKKAETTKAPDTTAAPAAETTAATAETTKAAETKSGCGSVAAIGVAAVVTVLGTAIISKKH